jgi:hypothetical protein
MVERKKDERVIKPTSELKVRNANHRYLFHAIQTAILIVALGFMLMCYFSPKKVGEKAAEFKAAYDSVLIVHNKFYSPAEK